MNNRFDSYKGFCIERLRAQSKKFKKLSEDTLKQPVKAIWAIGGVVGDGDFNDTSDVELLVELEENSESVADLEYELQSEIETCATDIGFISVYVGSPRDDEKKVKIC
jgi:predicted nucleotidyltransferase